MGSKIEQMCELSKLFQKSTYLDIPFTQVPFPLEIIPIWFNCFLSWPHEGVHLSKHLFYFLWYCMPQPQHHEIFTGQMHESRMVSQNGRDIFTTAVTHRDSLATQLSDEPWVWRFIFSSVRLYFTHSSCSLHLNTRLLPHGTRNGLHLGFLNDCQKGIDSENCHFPGSHSMQ